MRTYQAFGVVGLALLLVSCSKPTATDYYYPADLKSLNLPVWDVTNAIPLTPDRAVLAARSYATSQHPGISVWDVDSIELQKEWGTTNTWIYMVTLVDPKSGSREFGVHVLMDGSIWKPTKEKRY